MRRAPRVSLLLAGVMASAVTGAHAEPRPTLDASRGAASPARGTRGFVWSVTSPPLASALTPASVELAARSAAAAQPGITQAALSTARVEHVHDTGRGAIVVTLRQAPGGIDVFEHDLRVLLDRSLRPLATSGGLRVDAVPLPAPTLPLSIEDAVSAALSDGHGGPITKGALVDVGERPGGFREVVLAASIPGGTPGVVLTRPARVKPVWFALPERLVAAYYVEVFVGASGAIDADAYAYVLAADDARLLYRRSLTAHESFSYRVWAETTGTGRPLDGPIADFTPHPTGVPDGSYPAFVAPSLVSMEGFNQNPAGVADPWLAPGATVTSGNNVDAYTDYYEPDGFSDGDLRATTTGPLTFDRTFDPALDALASEEQSMAAVTQLFYVTNWLHDTFYDSGFDEAAGNAQVDNFGRGGVEGDPLLAEAQDGALAGNINNANMQTPADGASPRMQMYLWSGTDVRDLLVPSLSLSFQTGVANFGPVNFAVTAPLASVDDAVDPATDGCEPLVGDVVGKVALVDRGLCAFKVKAANAQAAGAVGMLVVDNQANASPPTMGDNGDPVDITIPLMSMTLADGAALAAALADGPFDVSMSRQTGPGPDGTIDNLIVAHEWGHFLHFRLVDCGSDQCGGQSEGWGDFLALYMAIRPGDDLHGTYSSALYGPLVNSADPAYFGIRRFPYTTDLSRNGLTFRHVADGEPLPQNIPWNPKQSANSEVHNTGEVWASMLLEAYVALLDQSTGPSPKYTFAEAERRMADYVVASMMLAPKDPTFTEQRDALLGAAFVTDPDDALLLAEAFAKRGAGSCAESPDRYAAGNVGVVESYEVAPTLRITSVALADDVTSCDDDGRLDAEERGTVRVRVENPSLFPVSDAVVEISSEASGYSVVDGLVDVGAMAPFEANEVAVEVTAAPGLVSMDRLVLTVRLTSAQTCEPEVVELASYRVNFDDVAAVSYQDDFDSELGAWSSASKPSGFEWERAEVEPLDFVWHGPDSGAAASTALTSPPIEVGSTEPFVIRFHHRFQFEYDAAPTYWDGGVLEISSDGGSSWADVADYADPGYGGVLTDQSGNPLANRSAFVAQSPSWPELDEVEVDFGSAFAGQAVLIRFRIGTDQAVGGYGWEVHDFEVEGAASPPFPAVEDDAGACNGAPSADAGSPRWSAPFAPVVLDASGSTDPDGDPLTFAWEQLSGTPVVLADASTASPTFVAPAQSDRLTFEVVVSDGTFSATDNVDVVVSALALPGDDRRRGVSLEEDDGCGCRVAGARRRSGHPAVFSLSALAAWALAWRWRRGRPRRGAGERRDGASS